MYFAGLQSCLNSSNFLFFNFSGTQESIIAALLPSFISDIITSHGVAASVCCTTYFLIRPYHLWNHLIRLICNPIDETVSRFVWYLLNHRTTYLCMSLFVTGTSSSRKMAEVGAVQRLPEWKPAQRIPVRGNELAAVQLVQQVKRQTHGNKTKQYHWLRFKATVGNFS